MIGHPLLFDLSDIRRLWPWALVLGLVLIILGAVALGATWLTTLFSILLAGWLLLLGGIAEFVSALLARRSGGLLPHLLVAILDVVIGLLMVRHPVGFAVAITLLLAALFLVGGVFRAIAALVTQPPNWPWAVLAGAVSALLGVMIWNGWPESADWVIGTFVGVELVLRGWWWVMFALAARHLPAGPGGAGTKS